MFPPYIDQFFYFIGEDLVFLGISLLIGAAIAAMLILYSFRTGHFLAASSMLVSISVMESAIKVIFRLDPKRDSWHRLRSLQDRRS